ncbi:MAG TPA: hypothetical protein VGM88_00195 [Kofleriaceae bacterium]|jgi:hypothetical protein
MRWIVPVTFLVATACGGPQIPQHNGYKDNVKQPWKKPKALVLNDKQELKTEGDLSYPDRRRARWYALDVPTTGQLDLALEVHPPGDETNDDFDLAMEILDPGNRVIAKADLEENDAHDLNKKRTLYELTPGTYLIHIYLQSRMDTADYILTGSFKATAPAEVKSDFPAQVEFLPALPMVPLQDDVPPGYKPPEKHTITVISHGTHRPTPPPPPTTATLSARVISIQVAGDGTQITVGRGTASGASDGMAGKLGIMKFTLGGCDERKCTATLPKTTIDQVKAAGGSVTLFGGK